MAKKAKVKVKSKPKGKTKAQSNGNTNRELIGKAKIRTIAHLRFNANGEPRKKGW